MRQSINRSINRYSQANFECPENRQQERIYHEAYCDDAKYSTNLLQAPPPETTNGLQLTTPDTSSPLASVRQGSYSRNCARDIRSVLAQRHHRQPSGVKKVGDGGKAVVVWLLSVLLNHAHHARCGCRRLGSVFTGRWVCLQSLAEVYWCSMTHASKRSVRTGGGMR